MFRCAVNSGKNPSVKKTKSLAEMFMPPLEVLFRGKFADAKAAAEKQKRYLLVNIQSASEFPSQMLNRDTWSDKRVKDLIKSRYVMWQYDKEFPQAQDYLQWYEHFGNPPYIAILDPRTGERLWNREQFLNADEMLRERSLSATTFFFVWMVP
jgi:hypothetical protein